MGLRRSSRNRANPNPLPPSVLPYLIFVGVTKHTFLASCCCLHRYERPYSHRDPDRCNRPLRCRDLVHGRPDLDRRIAISAFCGARHTPRTVLLSLRYLVSTLYVKTQRVFGGLQFGLNTVGRRTYTVPRFIIARYTGNKVKQGARLPLQ